MKGRGLLLRCFPYEPEQLRRGRLIETCLAGEPEDSYRLEQAQGPHRVAVGRVLGLLERYCNVALCREVVDLVGLHLLHHADQVRGVGEIAVMQRESAVLDVRFLV